jgi:hypothetical protein
VKSKVSGKAVASLILGIEVQAWTIFCIVGTIITIIMYASDSTYRLDNGYGLGIVFLGPALGLIALLPGILAVYLGQRARQEIHNSNGLLRGKHIAQIGFWLGYLVYGVLLFKLLTWPVGRVVRRLLKE